MLCKETGPFPVQAQCQKMTPEALCQYQTDLSYQRMTKLKEAEHVSLHMQSMVYDLGSM